MSDRIETGAGEVERDAVELAEELRDPRNGSLRAVVRRIESLGTMTNALGDSLRGRIVRGEDRIDALEKAETELAAKLLGHDAAIRGIEERATNLYRSTVARFDEIDRAEIALREKVAAVEQIVAVHGPKIGDINHALGKLAAECRKDFATLDERVERHRRVLSSKIARDAGVSVPAPSSPELEELRAARPCTCGDLRRVGMHRWYGQPCDVQPTGGVVAPRNPAPKIGEPFPSIAGDPLSPPPIARAIGRAVMAAAEKIPASNPTNARNFETVRAAADEAKAKAARRLSDALGALLKAWEEPTCREVLAPRILAVRDAMVEAIGADVIP